MAITSNTYTGNGSNKLFSITFPYLETTDVDVYLNGVLQTVTTQYTFANATTIEFVAAPGNGVTVILQRSTNKENLNSTFFPGSSIKAADLNENFDQLLYISQENTDVVNNLPTTVTMLRWKKTATAGQTVLTGNDDNAISLVYTAGFEQVYLNGAHLTRNADYTASDGATITMSVALLVGDLVEVMVYAPTSIVGTNSTGINFTQSGAGAVTRNVDSKLKEVVSVKDFGAVGNGTADDYGPIQAAINYALTQYQRVIGVIGGSFPVKKTRVIFPPGIYNVSSTLAVNGAGYQCVTLEGEGVATIRYTGTTGTCIYVNPIDTGLTLMTTPVEIKNLSIRKDDKASGSVGLVVERMTNCNFEALNFYGFQYAIKVDGAIDCDFDFKGQAIENCTFGMLIQQKTALGSVIKPNLTRVRNAYFINCSTNAIVIRKNPDESATNNGAGSVISIEDTNFQCASSGAAVSIESLGEVPNAGTVVLSRCWWEGHSLTALSLSNSQAVLNQCFITDAATVGGGRQIQLLDTTSRVTINELDAVFGVSPTQNAIVSRSAGTTSGLDAQVIARNVRISNPGISSVLLVPAGTCPVAVSNQSNIHTFDCLKSKYFHTQTITTGTLAASGGSGIVYDMGGNAGCYRVSAIQADGGIVWRGFADIFFNGASSSSITSTVNNISFTTTGSVIYVNNTNTGSSIQLIVSVLRVL